MIGSRLHRMQGNATVEVIIALLALSPLLIGIPLLGKQLDVKHKIYDASRYSVWERTVWSNAGSTHRKTESEIALESLDRTLGDPRSGLISPQAIRELGVGENWLWRDAGHERMIIRRDGAAPLQLTIQEQPPPAGVGYVLAPAIAHGGGVLQLAAEILRLRHLDLERRGFSTSSLSVSLRPVLPTASRGARSLAHAEPHEEPDVLVQRASAAILSDTWSPASESALRQSVDQVTANELIEALEAPGRPLGLLALGKGKPLYGEGRFGWDPDFWPGSNVLPASYLRSR